MKLTFNYYHNLEQVDLYLCNPDGRELFSLPAKNRHITLRFNDLSELTFDVDSKITLSDSNTISIEAYDFIETKRLIYALNIGWFQITNVDEYDNGVVKHKTVTAESYQSVLKNKGFISEEKVYCFYNPIDPCDDEYDSTKDDSIPSVIGQWNRQLGIMVDLEQGLDEPLRAYDDWTVTYIHPDLVYEGNGSICRTFKENVTYGYDWIINDVEDAFEVVVLFDFMYKTIHVMSPSEVTEKANIIYTFNNFMKSVNVNEDAKDIVTVLNCNGDNCDITMVNPTGTNYICDFSYYMDKVNHRWMSPDLIEKLEEWKDDCESEKTTYTTYISQLRALYQEQAEKKSELREMSLVLTDLRTAQNKRSVLGNGAPGSLCGIVCVESVKSGNTSIDSGSIYYSNAFFGDDVITAYLSKPTYSEENRRWEFSGESITGAANVIVERNLSDNSSSEEGYWYFSDTSNGSSYCKLHSVAKVEENAEESTYYCDGFERYIAYTYPIVDESTGTTTYTDRIQDWINLREAIVTTLNNEDVSLEDDIADINNCLKEISSRLNIISYFSNTPELLRELNCYWIEGDYTNENIAVLENTTLAEEIDLSNELLDSGYLELNKICRPRLSFSLESIDVTKNYEFKSQVEQLELGRIITIEKEEGLWYYPALLEISMNLDNSEEFSMTFANAMRLDDWGYTYADLITDSSSTSRRVSANWQNILAYSKNREEITSLIRNPLDMTLKAGFANMVNQEFIIDNTGILGRKKTSETLNIYEDEQIRLINNLLIFTDDNWKTAKTALGKIYYTDNDGNEVVSYGLIAETIVGSLLVGEKLEIKNPNSTVMLDDKGITIKQADGTIVFSAKPDGSLIINNYAKKDEVTEIKNDVDDLLIKIEEANYSIKVNAEGLEAKATAESVETLKTTVNSFSGDVTKLQTKMEEAETLITQNAHAITLKATAKSVEILQTTVDSFNDDVTELKTKITEAETQIAQNAHDITLKATAKEIETIKNNVQAAAIRIEEAESSIKTNAEGIEAKASAKAVETIDERLTDAESKLTINTTNISAKVSATHGLGERSFAWSLTDSGFYIYSNGTSAPIMSVSAGGLEVKGVVRATSGEFENCTIKNTCEFHGKVTGESGCIEYNNGVSAATFIDRTRIELYRGNSNFIVNEDDDGGIAFLAYSSISKTRISLNSNGGTLSGTWDIEGYVTSSNFSNSIGQVNGNVSSALSTIENFRQTIHNFNSRVTVLETEVDLLKAQMDIVGTTV